MPDLAGYEQLLLGQILTIPSVVEAQSTRPRSASLSDIQHVVILKNRSVSRPELLRHRLSGVRGEWLTGNLPAAAGGINGPVGLGFRVPCMVISPFSRGGYVCSQRFDHTSLLRFIETRFGVSRSGRSSAAARCPWITCGARPAVRPHAPRGRTRLKVSNSVLPGRRIPRAGTVRRASRPQ